MAYVFKDLPNQNAPATLASAITSGATTIVLTTGTGTLLPSPTGGDLAACRIEQELVTYTTRTTDTLTGVVRGVGGTTAVAHSAGKQVRNVASAAFYNAAGGGSGASSLDGLSDVTITSPSSGQTLRHNGSGQFVNAQLGHSDLSGLTSGNPHTQYEQTANKGAASGYAPLDSGLLVPIANLPTGTTSTTVALGNDSRFPTSGEKAALAGTSGTPGSGNKYVTDGDSRNTNTRTPTAHAIDGAAHTGSLAHSSLSGLTSGDPHTQYQQESEKGAANGYASLGAGSLVPIAQLATGTPTGSKFLRDDQVLAVPSGGASALDDLTDVTITSPATGDALSYNGSAWVNQPGGSSLVANANSSVPGGNTVSNTTAETNFSSTATIPANTLTAGRVIEVIAHGVYSTAITGGILLKVKFGSTVLCATGTITPSLSLTNQGWTLQARIDCFTAGASGTVDVQGWAALSTAAMTAALAQMSNTSTVTVDTTTAQTCQISVTWNEASASDSITLRQILVKTLPAGSAGGGSGLYSAYLCYQDQKASTTNGGTFTSGAWRTRNINTEVADTGGHGSVASDQITLAAGTYDYVISCPAYQVASHQARLQDVTNAVTLGVGTAEWCANTSNVQTRSVIVGTFTLPAPAALEIQHHCSSTQATNGFGVPRSVTTEVFTVAQFFKRA